MPRFLTGLLFLKGTILENPETPETNGAIEAMCQCCAMPIQKEEEFGCNADKSKNEDYCCNCFQDGTFTFDMPFEQFAQRWVAVVTDKLGMPEDKALEIAQHLLPNLKRWKKQ